MSHPNACKILQNTTGLHVNDDIGRDVACPVPSGRFLDPADKAFQTRLTSQAMTEAQIKQATSNYANLLGRGGFGSVYYGKLPDGQEVAAKVLSSNSHQSKHEFYNEVMDQFLTSITSFLDYI